MLFTEFRFFAFFLLVFGVHWLLSSNGARKGWLLCTSYFFYAAWDWRFLSLILFSTYLDYGVGRMLDRAQTERRRRAWLALSLAGNLYVLGLFKYFGFFVESAAAFLDLIGFPTPLPTLRLILPVGISFYTFQTLSYTIDIYRRELRPTRNLLDLALFVGFFPQLVAGPIVRARDFLPQLRSPRRLVEVDVRSAATLFLIGFVKKACISDNLARIADPYFASPESYDALSAWAATFFYTVQVYCDFSGYSDMAIASAALLGFRLKLNFDFPYFASNIAQFWRRWHISLSSWLRDYLYIPLGGNRGSRLFVYRNLMITLTLCGLWHGAAWNFVLFGALHGLAVSLRLEWRVHVEECSLVRRVVAAVAGPLTVLYFAATLIPFRSESWGHTVTTAKAFFFLDATGTESLGWSFTWIVPIMAVVHWISYRGWAGRAWARSPGWIQSLMLGGGAALALQWAAREYKPFVYFQF